MNYDLAMMALEGMARAPMSLRVDGGEVVIEGEAASFKELARLCAGRPFKVQLAESDAVIDL